LALAQESVSRYEAIESFGDIPVNGTILFVLFGMFFSIGTLLTSLANAILKSYPHASKWMLARLPK
jgi:hypothetical protein